MTLETFEKKIKHLSSVVLDIYKFIDNDGDGRIGIVSNPEWLCAYFKKATNKFIDTTVFYSKIKRLNEAGLITVEEDLLGKLSYRAVEVESRGSDSK